MGDMSLRRAGPTLSGPADLFFKLVINFNSSSGSTGQWSNYGWARGGLAYLKELAAPAKHLF